MLNTPEGVASEQQKVAGQIPLGFLARTREDHSQWGVGGKLRIGFLSVKSPLFKEYRV